MNKIDVVLPLIGRDLPRFKLLYATLRANFPDLGQFLVVLPESDIAGFRAAYRGPFVVVAESELVPELRYCRPPGWYVQQVVKLVAHERVDTPYYLTLDADMLVTRRVTADELIRDGRAMCPRRHHDLHDQWYDWAERILRVKSSGWKHGLTPTLYSREGMARLAEFLERDDEGVGARLWWYVRSKLSRFYAATSYRAVSRRNWRYRLLRRLPWAEQALYFTFLEGNGLFDVYHQHTGQEIYGNCVWVRETLADWDPAPSFDPAAPFAFTIVNSTTGITAPELEQRVRQYTDRLVAPDAGNAADAVP